MTANPSELDDRLARIAGVAGARPVGIKAIEIGPAALAQLPALLARHRPDGPDGDVALLVDVTPMDYAGADLYDSVSTLLTSTGRSVRRVVVQSVGGRAHADAATIDDAVREVEGSAVLVALGSGTLVDIGKAVSARLGGLFHVVVQTALSVNGYSDDQSVLLIEGVKRTTPTRWPDVVIADTTVLAGAPRPLNAAGVGDLAAMFTAPADWQLATLLDMGAGYLPELVAVVRELGPGLVVAAAGLAGRDRAAIDYVAQTLTLSGLSMGAAGVTAPSSGAEHTMSHLIEMSADARGRPSAYHGAQVGVCTVLATLVWQRVRSLLADGPVTLQFPSESLLEAQVHAAFDQLDPSGAMSQECWRLYQRKLARWNEKKDQLENTDWASVDAAVASQLAPPETIIDMLRAAGTPTRFRDLDEPVDPETARWALANCHLMRDRFTVVDLAYFLGAWNPGAADEILAEAAELGAGL